MGALPASIVAASLILALSSPVLAGRGDCSQPVSNGASPAVTDCLYILRTALDLEVCQPRCACQPRGGPTTTVTDALSCLSRVVGGSTPLICPPPCAEFDCSVDADTAFDEGRRLLEAGSLAVANLAFECALGNDPEHSAANFFYALTRFFNWLAFDEDLAALLITAGGSGSRDPYRYDFRFAEGSPTPPIASIKPVAFGAFDRELAGAIANLGVAISDPAFQTTVTGAMLNGLRFAQGNAVEIDGADARVIRALAHYLRFKLYFTIGAYAEATFDEPLRDLTAVFEPDCGETFIAEHPEFFTVASPAALAEAKAALGHAIDDLIAGLYSIASESDAQHDDLFITADPAGLDGAVRSVGDGWLAVLTEMRASLDGPITDLPGCPVDGSTFFVGPLFDTPLTRDDMPRLGGFPYTRPTPPASCGNGVCDANESDHICAEDCGCAAPSTVCGGIAPDGCRCDAGCLDDPNLGSCCADACTMCQVCRRGQCKVAGEFPDPTLHGIFPGVATRDELKTLLYRTDRCMGDGFVPDNDLCTDAHRIAETPYLAIQDASAATVSVDDPELSCGRPGRYAHSVWYRLDAPMSGILRVDTSSSIHVPAKVRWQRRRVLGTTYDTLIAVHTGSCGALSEIACNDNFREDFFGFLQLQAELRVPVTAGETYYLEVTSSASGPASTLVFEAWYDGDASISTSSVQ